MNTRYLGILGAAIVALSPQIAAAAPGKTSLDACVRAFEAKLGANPADSAKYVVNFADGVDTSAVSFRDATNFTFDMAARDSKTGTTKVRATCSATRGGKILYFVQHETPKT